MRYKYHRKDAKINFDNLEKGILQIIRAADIYAVHAIANHQNREPDRTLVNRIISQNKLSGFSFLGGVYSDDIRKFLEEGEELKYIGQQILLSTYTAFEVYLIEKFREYYRFILNDKASEFVEKSLKRFSSRNLEDIKRNYRDIFQIHLPSFDIEKFYTHEKSNFKPKDSWEAITLIAGARDEIAHKGASTKYRVVTLLDSWFPFDFMRRWVQTFDGNFDFLIYGGFETNPIKEYKKRVQASKK